MSLQPASERLRHYFGVVRPEELRDLQLNHLLDEALADSRFESARATIQLVRDALDGETVEAPRGPGKYWEGYHAALEVWRLNLDALQLMEREL